MRVQKTDTPLRLLAQYVHVDLPLNGTREQKSKALEQIEHNLMITIEFGDTQIGQWPESSEIFDTIMEARAQAILAIGTKKAANCAGTLKDFNTLYELFRNEYDTLRKSVKHIFWLADRGLYSRVDEAM